MKRPLIGLLFLLCTSLAHADTIRFTNVYENFLPGSTYVEGDYLITFSGYTGGIVTKLDSRSCVPPCPDNGTFYLANQTMDAIVLSRLDGTAFTLTSFDGGELHADVPYLWASAIRVTGGEVSATFELDFIQDGPGAANDFQTFVLPTTSRSQLSYTFSGVPTGLSLDYSLDNLNVEATPTPVPEPGTMFLFATGAVAVIRRVRKKVSQRKERAQQTDGVGP